MNTQEAIKIIEEKTVYRVTSLCDDGSAFFTSTNGMPQTNFTKAQIIDLATLSKDR